METNRCLQDAVTGYHKDLQLIRIRANRGEIIAWYQQEHCRQFQYYPSNLSPLYLSQGSVEVIDLVFGGSALKMMATIVWITGKRTVPLALALE